MKKRNLWVVATLMIAIALLAAACAPAAQGTPTSAIGVATQAGGVPTTAPMVETPTQAMAATATSAPAMAETATSAPAMAETATSAQAAAGTPTAGAAATLGPAPTLAQIGGEVSVLGVWGGAELDNFNAVIAPFEQQTGIKVNFEGTRDLPAVLTTRVQGGNPPDLAGLPGPGQLVQFAKSGDLVPLNDILDMNQLQQNYDQGFINLTTVNDKVYGIFTKAAVKSLVWYNPKSFDAAGYQIPTNWDEMQALEQQIISDGVTPWCIGLESGAASGWPGTDWIEDMMLRTAGPDTYDQWVQHQIAWTDDPVKNAWTTWGDIVNDPQMVYGGSQTVLSTNFGEAFFPMFDDPPGCYMLKQADFITTFIQDQYPDAVAGQDYNFFVFPPIDEQYGNPLLVGGDLFGMFNDTPQAEALIEYLTTPQAQQIWASKGGFLSPNKNVPASVYPDQLTGQIADLLNTATSVRFDASDQMPEAVNNAFWSGVLDYVSNPDQLDSILQNLEQTAQSAYQSQ